MPAGRTRLLAQVDLDVAQAWDRFDPTSPANLRSAIDSYLETRPGASQLEALRSEFGVSDTRARALLEKVVDHYSSPAVQRQFRLTDQALKAATTTAQVAKTLSAAAATVLAVPAAIETGSLYAITLALTGIAAASYKMQGDILVAQGKAIGDKRLVAQGEGLQEAGSIIDTVAGYAGKIDPTKLRRSVCDGKAGAYLADIAKGELKGTAKGVAIAALKDPEAAAAYIRALDLARAAAEAEWGEPAPAPGQSVPATQPTGTPGSLTAGDVPDLPTVGPVPGGPRASIGLTGDVNADFGLGATEPGTGNADGAAARARDLAECTSEDRPAAVGAPTRGEEPVVPVAAADPPTAGAAQAPVFSTATGSTTDLVRPVPGGSASDIEPNDNTTMASPLPPTASVSGTMSAGGDTDFFAVETEAQGELTLTVETDVPLGRMELGVQPARGGNWLPDTSQKGDGVLRVDLPSPGRYIVRARASEPQASDAAYRVASTFRPSPDLHEPNDAVGVATPVSPDGTIVGAMLPAGDTDFFKVSVPDAGEWTIDVRGLPDGLQLGLGAHPAGGGNWITDHSEKGDGKLVVDLPAAGDYILRVREQAGKGSVDPYVLATGFVPTGDAGEPNDATAIAAPVEGTGSIVATILPAGDTDHFIFDAPAQGEWKIEIEDAPELFDIGLGVHPARGGNWISDRSPKGDGALVVDLPAPGRYILRVRDQNGGRSAQSYRLGTRFTPSEDAFEPNDATALAAPIPADGTITGTILPAGDTDFFLLDAPAAGEWTVAISGAPETFDLGLGVHPARGGNWLSDVSPKGDGKLVVDLPEPGRYVLRIVDSNSERSVVSYAVGASFVPAQDAHEPNDRTALAKRIPAEGTIRGAILPAGDVDFFLFTGTEGDIFTAEIVSAPEGMDVGLGVHPGTGGNWLSDRSPKGDGVLEVELPETGAYILRVTDQNNRRAPENYVLSTTLR